MLKKRVYEDLLGRGSRILFRTRSIDLSCCLNLLDVFFGPVADTRHERAQRSSKRGQRVLDLWRNTGVNAASNDAVPLQIAECLRQNFLRNAIHGSPELNEP